MIEAAALPAVSASYPPGGAFRVNFAWLSRLRFGAVLGQLFVILVVHFGLGEELPLFPLGVVLALELLVNAWAVGRLRNLRQISATEVALGVGADLVLFSALLYFTGGPSNPFSFLYLVHIALAAIVLPQRTSFALVGLALACSLGLFFAHVPLGHDHSHHHGGYNWHLRGMWVAFGVGACLIVYFIQRVQHELAAMAEKLRLSRERAARNEHLAVLAMLSTGAAHELGSPLATIAVASSELMRSLPPEASQAREDLALIRSQVARCREIVDQLSLDAGQARGAAVARMPAREVLAQALAGVPRERVANEPSHAGELEVVGPAGALAQALRNLIQNALDATAPDGRVRLRIERAADEVRLEVADDGPGMSREVLIRATEPFFTTKPRGRGMGLGLFLAQSVAEQVGGRLELASSAGQGTRASLVLPMAATNGRMVLGQPTGEARTDGV
jgi:two-component system, sensor histidine kinase RegB